MNTQPRVPELFRDYMDTTDVAGGIADTYINSMPLRDILEWHQAAIAKEAIIILDELAEWMGQWKPGMDYIIHLQQGMHKISLRYERGEGGIKS